MEKDTRQLRKRRVQYKFVDEIPSKFSIVQKLKEPRYTYTEGLCSGLVRHLPDGKNVNIKLFQSEGFTSPLVIHSMNGLGMKMPPNSFNVSDIQRLVGPTRRVDAIDCDSQRAVTMSLKQFCQYYQSGTIRSKQHRKLNVISLEFSHTQLDPMVEVPALVKELDWVRTVWPKRLISMQKDSTNDMRRMMYPKVIKYCLMSVSGCYTDFHIDFGGTSVWYHILKGEKVFLLIPPSKKNYDAFTTWHRDELQETVFFGDMVEACETVHLKAGDTMFIPSGWIHAVYTPKHSIVFGGNFLNCFSIVQQLEVAKLESVLKVRSKFCYPFYEQIHWYLVNECQKLLTRLEVSYTSSINKQSIRSKKGWLKDVAVKKLSLDLVCHEVSKYVAAMIEEENDCENKLDLLPHITAIERKGLLLLVRRMKDEHLFASNIPSEIENPEILLQRLEKQLLSTQLESVTSPGYNGITLLHHLISPPTTLPRHSKAVSTSANPIQSSVVQDIPFSSLASQEIPLNTYSNNQDKNIFPHNLCTHLQPISESSYSSIVSTMEASTHPTPTTATTSSSIAVTPSFTAVTPSSTAITPSLTAVTPSFTAVTPSFTAAISSSTAVTPSSTAVTLEHTTPVVSNFNTTGQETVELTKQSKSPHKTSVHYLSTISSTTLDPHPPSRKKSRLVRCRKCDACRKQPCGNCKYCLDNPSRGGPNKLKKCCILRRCTSVSNPAHCSMECMIM